LAFSSVCYAITYLGSFKDVITHLQEGRQLHPLPLSARQLLPIPVLLLAPYVFTYLCVVDTSIYITPQNHRVRLHDYPFDNVLFHPDTICSTCNLVKPARSKHCSLCNACVSRSDHHCPWVNNCLGRTNYRWFLALLLSLFVLESYGAFLSFSLLSPYLLTSGSEIAGQSLFSTAYWSNVGDKVARAVNEGGLSTAGVGMLSASTAPLPLGLLAYHIYLVWAGMTTNETQKWADWREDMADGVVFRAKYSEVLAREQELKAQRLRTGDGQAFASGREMAPLVDWPVASNQHVVRTNDGRPPNGREHLYEQIWSLNAVDNIYDLGLWDNFMYVLKGR